MRRIVLRILFDTSHLIMSKLQHLLPNEDLS
jgi:hypothetical protein